MSDLYFAWCEDRAEGHARGWHLLYPATGEGEEDLYVGPFATFEAAYLASLEERP